MRHVVGDVTVKSDLKGQKEPKTDEKVQKIITNLKFNILGNIKF